jgi:DNA-binding NarL/FixJ family response regulator
LIEVIDKVVRGKQVAIHGTGSELADFEGLGKNGHRVMELVAGGFSNKFIAEKLAVTQKTVEYYVDLGYRALGVDKSTNRNARVDATLRYQELFGSGVDDEAAM